MIMVLLSISIGTCHTELSALHSRNPCVEGRLRKHTQAIFLVVIPVSWDNLICMDSLYMGTDILLYLSRRRSRNVVD